MKKKYLERVWGMASIRNIFAITTVCVILSACVAGTGDLPFGLARIDNNTIVTDVSRDDGFGPSEQIWVYERNRGTRRVGIDRPTGLSYSYHPDRNIRVFAERGRDPVSTFCRTDAMTDRRTCQLGIGVLGGVLMVQLGGNGSILGACVLGHDFPGRVARIRVDSFPAVSTNTDGCVSAGTARKLVTQMRRGGVVLTDLVSWPYEVRRTNTANIAGSVDLAIRLWGFVNSASLQATLFKVDESDLHKQDIALRNGQ